MFTGPRPTMSGGEPYRDADNNIVEGPTIPHYSIPDDPLFHVGSPSMSVFYYNPVVCCDGSGSYYDPEVGVYSGSGVNLDPSGIYHYTGIYNFLGPDPYSLTVAENEAFSEESGFIMLATGVYGFWPSDAGRWQYTETWTNVQDPLDSISYTADFELRPVPEPGSLMLLGSGLMGAAAFIRRKILG